MSLRPLLIWEGRQASTHSLARCNESYCDALLDADAVDLRIVSNQREWESLEDNPRRARRHALDAAVTGLPLRDALKRPSLWVQHHWPPRSRPPGPIPWVIMQPWEYSLIPTNIVEIFNRTREIWTASQFAARAFRDSGVTVPVRVMPLGVHRAHRVGSSTRTALTADDEIFRFLFVGATIYRKGVDVLLSAFARAFGPTDPVGLIIKDVAPGSVYEGQTAAERVREFADDRSRPHVEYINTSLSESEMLGLYERCDVFVSSYRGEGFSMPTLEAMAAGRPVIVTAAGATDDFVDDSVGWRIPSSQRSVGSSIYGQPTPGEAYLLEPDQDELVKLLHQAFEDRDEVRRRGAAAKQRAEQQWSWGQAAQQVQSRVFEILDQP